MCFNPSQVFPESSFATEVLAFLLIPVSSSSPALLEASLHCVAGSWPSVTGSNILLTEGSHCKDLEAKLPWGAPVSLSGTPIYRAVEFLQRRLSQISSWELQVCLLSKNWQRETVLLLLSALFCPCISKTGLSKLSASAALQRSLCKMGPGRPADFGFWFMF